MNLLRETKEILNFYGIRLSKRLGQHFLIDEHIIKREVELAQLSEKDTVLEVGPGIGNLTRELLKHSSVIAVEKSPVMVEILSRRFPTSKLKVIEGDFLDVDVQGFTKVVSNIPYSISSEFIFKILRHPFEKAVFTVQKEFGRRLVAKAGTREYSRISAAIQLLADVKIPMQVPRSAFFPMPKVNSVVVELKPKKVEVNVERYLNLLRLIFPYRRRVLEKALRFGMKRAKMEIKLKNLPVRLLEKRVFQLSPDELAEVAELALPDKH